MEYYPACIQPQDQTRPEDRERCPSGQVNVVSRFARGKKNHTRGEPPIRAGPPTTNSYISPTVKITRTTNWGITWAKYAYKVVRTSVVRFVVVSGADHAAAFAFYAFFSFFPIILLIVTTASLFIDKATVSGNIIEFLKQYMPLDDAQQNQLAGQVTDVIEQGNPARVLGILALIWAGLRFFKSLVHTQNVIWQTKELPWWSRPLKSAILLAVLMSTLVLGVIAPSILEFIKDLPMLNQACWLKGLFKFSEGLIPVAVLFYGLFLFYKLSPQTAVSARDCWLPALLAAVLLTVSRKGLIALIGMTIQQYGVYKTFGAIIAVIYAVYFSGLIIIFCGCLCAALHNVREQTATESSS